MKKTAAYTVTTPKALRGEFFSQDFYIGATKTASEISMWWRKAPLGERCALLKLAEEADTEDLAEVYDEFKAKSQEKSKGSEEE